MEGKGGWGGKKKLLEFDTNEKIDDWEPLTHEEKAQIYLAKQSTCSRRSCHVLMQFFSPPTHTRVMATKVPGSYKYCENSDLLRIMKADLFPAMCEWEWKTGILSI